jgi:oleandomycin transport system ATP-binding protein
MEEQMETGIEAEGLRKTFGSIRALNGIDMVVRPGTVFSLLGPNGAGKTTAIRVLSTLLRPDSGRAMVGGYDVVRAPGEVRRLIGLTGQYAAVDELLSGHENLYMLGRLVGLRAPDSRTRARELLTAFDLIDAATKLVKSYSGGMRRRLDLAASIVGRPRFLYLDEPTTGLDPRSRRRLWDMIRALVAEEPEQLKTRVGGQVLQVEPADPADLQKAGLILAAFAEGDEGASNDGRFVTVTISDRSKLGHIVRLLDNAGIAVGDLSVRRPSLDEVFLALTHHVAGEEPRSHDTMEGSTA